jgi:hypothetical protein
VGTFRQRQRVERQADQKTEEDEAGRSPSSKATQKSPSRFLPSLPDSSTLISARGFSAWPLFTYSGYDLDEDDCGGVHVKKPASMSTLVAAVRGLLAERQISN